ncbi:MAG: inner membrane CreD family protein [Acidobacteria bacterium]|nr:inner membrane CreD family protein [Acidobacteriota bacterium]
MNILSRLAAIFFIFVCTTLAWFFLGLTVDHRTNTTDGTLRGKVATIWGSAQEQHPPQALWFTQESQVVTTIENNINVQKTRLVEIEHPLPLEGSRIQVDLNLAHRQKGLRWYSTYTVAFDGTYRFRNDTAEAKNIVFQLPFPSSQAMYRDLVMTLDGKAMDIENQDGKARAKATVAAGATVSLRAAYQSQGLDQWRYHFGQTEVSQAKDFELDMKTNFKDIDFAENTLSPVAKRETADGWELTWKYDTLVSGYQLAMVMPEKLQPGPLVGAISYFAPVSLFFFFFILLVITTLRNVELHPMNYFFLAAAFFAFHLLLAYLCDLISIHLAFWISAAVSVFLVVSYLRAVVGIRFAALEAGGAQLIYLVLFSYAFFFKGVTGLAVTIGSILTLFVVMQLTAKINWQERFGSSRRESSGPPSLIS